MAYNILIVDDSKIVRTVIERAIHLSGVEIGKILQAANGQEALDHLGSAWVDIVFADINMPVMDGVEMVEEMDRRGLVRDIPVVIVSTDRSEMRMQQLKAHGVKEYLNKPFTPEAIRDILATCLKERDSDPSPPG
ncbi:MAG: response regulator [Lentisphaerae bacterium]|nr:response regulator [Lentisphaerota bacterium]